MAIAAAARRPYQPPCQHDHQKPTQGESDPPHQKRGPVARDLRRQGLMQGPVREDHFGAKSPSVVRGIHHRLLPRGIEPVLRVLGGDAPGGDEGHVDSQEEDHPAAEAPDKRRERQAHGEGLRVGVNGRRTI
jgi:hypothetical protein